jgi:hypothetical protein
MHDVFSTCTEAAAKAGLRHGIYEWEARAELTPGHEVTLGISWQPEDVVPLAEVVTAARQAWEQLRTTELSHRRSAAAEVNGHQRWLCVRTEDMFPEHVFFQPDGSVEISYHGIETGGHGFTAEVSPAGEYLGYRIE